MKVAAPPYSPPVENPWVMRNSTSSRGAQNPIDSYDGTAPSRTVEPPINRMVSARIWRRPNRSPSGPHTKPPSGRMTKETAKTPSVSSVADSRSPGKNESAM